MMIMVIFLKYKLNYQIEGEGEEVLFIPGWNDNLKHFLPIAKKIKGYKFILIDLPNQGDSKKINKRLEMQDYIDLINSCLKENNLKPKIIIGHSFGGKLGYLYARKYDVNKLILLAPSLIRNKSLITYFKIYKYKLLKYLRNELDLKINLDKYGSKEYLTMQGVGKENFIVATNSYYNKDLGKLKIPTLLYYGKKDNVTPLKEAKYILRRIKNSKLVIDEDGDHFAVYQNPYKFIRTFKEFVND